MLAREYIGRALYGPGGYFTRPSGPFVACDVPANWRAMAGRRDYDAFVSALYARAQNPLKNGPRTYDRPRWHTASEVFRPEYGRLFGRALLSRDFPQVMDDIHHDAFKKLFTLHHPQVLDDICPESSKKLFNHHPQVLNDIHYHSLKEFSTPNSPRVVNDTFPKAFQKLLNPNYPKNVEDTCPETDQRRGNLPSNGPIAIYELGPGRGSLAVDMLDWLAARHAELYERCTYVLVEASEPIAHALAARMAATAHGRKVSVRCGGPITRDERAAYVLGVEVLDNLVHDVVRIGSALCRMSAVNALSRRKSAQATESVAQGHVDAEGVCFAPLSDARIADFVERFGRHLPRGLLTATECWIPTGLAYLLDELGSALPNVRALALADFDALPDVLLRGNNAPLVQAVDADGVPLSCDTLCVPVGAADIMFPTDFALLASMVDAAFGGRLRSAVCGHSAFVRGHCDIAAMTTASGFCPIAEDYANQSVLTAYN